MGYAHGEFSLIEGVLAFGGDGDPTIADGVEPTETQKKTLEDLQLRDLKVKNDLFQAIDRMILETILDKEYSKSI